MHSVLENTNLKQMFILKHSGHLGQPKLIQEELSSYISSLQTQFILWLKLGLTLDLPYSVAGTESQVRASGVHNNNHQ